MSHTNAVCPSSDKLMDRGLFMGSSRYLVLISTSHNDGRHARASLLTTLTLLHVPMSQSIIALLCYNYNDTMAWCHYGTVTHVTRVWCHENVSESVLQKLSLTNIWPEDIPEKVIKKFNWKCLYLVFKLFGPFKKFRIWSCIFPKITADISSLFFWTNFTVLHYQHHLVPIISPCS